MSDLTGDGETRSVSDLTGDGEARSAGARWIPLPVWRKWGVCRISRTELMALLMGEVSWSQPREKG